MLNDIISGICEAIAAEFGPGYKVYKTTVNQGLERPCLVVDFVDQREEHFPSKRQRRFNMFSVRYVPRNVPDAKLECYDAQDRLYDALEYIMTAGGLMRGNEIHGQMVDGELMFTVNYDYNVRHVEEAPIMETLEIVTDAS